jgi:hypothetical protein
VLCACCCEVCTTVQPDLRAASDEGAAELRQEQVVEHWVVGTTDVEKACMVCFERFGLDANRPVAGCVNSFAHTLCGRCSGRVSQLGAEVGRTPACPRCRGRWAEGGGPQASCVWSLLQADQERANPAKRAKVE